MTMLNAIPGDPLANSYVTVEDASAFLTRRLDTAAWTHASTPDQSAALQWATQLLDGQVKWYGIPTYPDQALALPQTGLIDSWGRWLPSDVIPAAVSQATALYALSLLDATGVNGALSGETLVLKSKKIADTTLTYQDVSSTSTRAPVAQDAMPSEVKALLRPYGAVPGLGVVPLVRT
jgi:Putative DnaT-like ssDNA binding protein